MWLHIFESLIVTYRARTENAAIIQQKFAFLLQYLIAFVLHRRNSLLVEKFQLEYDQLSRKCLCPRISSHAKIHK